MLEASLEVAVVADSVAVADKRNRSSAAQASSTAWARPGVDASSLTMHAKSRCVCSRIDRICLARRSSAGSYVAIQTAMVGVIGAGTVAGSFATSG